MIIAERKPKLCWLNITVYLFLARGDFCHLLITFANSLDPDQGRQIVGPDLDQNCLTLMVFLKESFEKVNFEKYQQTMTKQDAKRYVINAEWTS